MHAQISRRQLVGIPLTVACFLLLMAMGWGDLRGFLSHPARVGLVIMLIIATPVMTACTSGRDRGVGHEADDWWFFPALVFHSLFTCLAMPYMDARDLWMLPGGDFTRWLGFALFATGVLLRLAAMLALGRRFVSVIAVQAGHTLYTEGLYAAIRHPSYLGILFMDLGFAGVFRSSLALALMPLVFVMFARRMDAEERFLTARFGGEYDAYRARSARLWPGVY
jgi:protein-S-isoprenylcysteine O-methyltransferase Ste14